MSLLISAAAIALTIFLYRKNLLGALWRTLSIIILYILITNFTINIPVKQTFHPAAVLVDYSASMTDYLPTIMEKLNKLKFPHTLFFFSESLARAPKDPGAGTDITSALEACLSTNPSAIILISDGNHNYGEAPIAKIDDFTTAIYSFGVGSEKQRDISIVDILYPAYAYKGDSIKIKVIVEAKGFSGGEGKIWLKIPFEKIVRSKSFPLSDVTAKNDVEFWINLKEPGQKKVRVSLTPQVGEENYQNNDSDFSLDIIEKKISVLYYADHLSFNTKFIFRAFTDDENIDFLPIAKKDKDKFFIIDKNININGVPSLDGFDALILDNVNFQKLPWPDIAEHLKRGLGILCVGSVEGLTDQWRDILPINSTETIINGNFDLKVVQSFSDLETMNDYPPVEFINQNIGTKNNAVIIAQAHQLPVIAYQNYLRSIIFQINIVDIGTWFFMQNNLKQQDLLSQFVGDIIRFITTLGKNRRLVIRSSRNEYLLGTIINLNLQSYDRNFKIMGGGDFYADFADTKIPFFEGTEGFYEATLFAQKSGKFSVYATGKLGAEVLKSNILELTILPQMMEKEKGLNKQLLLTLSEKTGGVYNSIDALESFDLPTPGLRYDVRQIDFNKPISYFLIFMLLAIDWFMRRRRGTI